MSSNLVHVNACIGRFQSKVGQGLRTAERTIFDCLSNAVPDSSSSTEAMHVITVEAFAG